MYIIIVIIIKNDPLVLFLFITVVFATKFVFAFICHFLRQQLAIYLPIILMLLYVVMLASIYRTLCTPYVYHSDAVKFSIAND